MRRCFVMLAAALVFPLSSAALSPSDFPLRLHIFEDSQRTRTAAHSSHETVEGYGRANLFEHSQARGADFTFVCDHRVRTSSGYETYPARWVTRGQSLAIYMPVIGQPNAGQTCELKVSLKDFAYGRRDGKIATEPVADYKKWMDKHHYDPEHNQNTPMPDAKP